LLSLYLPYSSFFLPFIVSSCSFLTFIICVFLRTPYSIIYSLLPSLVLLHYLLTLLLSLYLPCSSFFLSSLYSLLSLFPYFRTPCFSPYSLFVYLFLIAISCFIALSPNSLVVSLSSVFFFLSSLYSLLSLFPCFRTLCFSPYSLFLYLFFIAISYFIALSPNSLVVSLSSVFFFLSFFPLFSPLPLSLLPYSVFFSLLLIRLFIPYCHLLLHCIIS